MTDPQNDPKPAGDDKPTPPPPPPAGDDKPTPPPPPPGGAGDDKPTPPPPPPAGDDKPTPPQPPVPPQQPQGGYAPPPQGYPPPQPQGGYAPPPQGYPPQGYQQPQGGYAPPPQGYPPQQPQGGYAPPPQGYPPQGGQPGAAGQDDTTPANFQLGTKLPKVLKVKCPANQLKFDQEKFITLLAGSISLSKDEKKKIVESVPKLKQEQIDELIRIFEEEKQKFAALSQKHTPQLEKLAEQHYQEWMELENEVEHTQKKAEDTKQADEIRKNLGL